MYSGTDEQTPAGVLLIGARGWEHGGWTPEYYPADLPADWRLAYFSNEFDAILVPGEYWDGPNREQLPGLLDDVREGFRVYTEVPPSLLVTADSVPPGGLNEWLDDLDTISGGIAGLLLRMDRVTEAAGGLPGKMLPELGERFPLYVTGVERQSLDPGTTYAAVFPLPEMTAQATEADGTNLAVVENHTGLAADLRQLRSVIEWLRVSAPGTGEAVLLFDGNPPAINDLRNARIIDELLAG